MIDIGHLDADRFSAPGGQPVLVVDARKWRRPASDMQAVVIGTDRDGAMPAVKPGDFDLLLTSRAGPPAPWIGLRSFDSDVESLVAAVHANPLAATIAAAVLRSVEPLPLSEALRIESLGYSTLRGGSEFARWRAAHPVRCLPSSQRPKIVMDREGDQLRITLDDPENRNAMSAAMRDALYEALTNALDDPTRPSVVLNGAGKCFSSGGALHEFGTATDLAEAHAVRVSRSCARALDALGERATVQIHGACIGSGIEIAAAAHRRIAALDAWFELPEIAMGLIPGAGGTATVSRAIGRHRTMWMLLSGKRIGAKQALEWGLVHAIGDRT